MRLKQMSMSAERLAAGRVPLPGGVDLVAHTSREQLAKRLLPLIREGFPEREWDEAEVDSVVLRPADWLMTFEALSAERTLGVISLHAAEDAERAKLHWLAVTAAARGRGIGSALLAAAARAAVERGHQVVFLRTEADKADALRLYAALGFREEDLAG